MKFQWFPVFVLVFLSVLPARSEDLSPPASIPAPGSSNALLEMLSRIEKRLDAIERKLAEPAPVPALAVAPSAVTREIKVSVIGSVRDPGRKVVEEGDGILTAIAAAGGTTPGGDLKRVTVDRKGKPLFKLNLKSEDRNFRIENGDVITVQESLF